MKKWGLLFLCFLQILSANPVVTENEPSAIVDGVHVITGDLYLKKTDIVIQGAEPLILQRTYISDKGKGYWQFLNSHIAFARSGLLEITEQSGAKLFYRWDTRHTGKTTLHSFSLLDNSKEGLTNTGRGILSGNTNLKNQHIQMIPSGEEFVVHCPNGSRKVYKSTGRYCLDEFFDIELTKLKRYTKTFVITREYLPNGNMIVYDWPKKKNEVWQIRTCDASGKTVYAWAKFYPHKGKKGRSHGDYGIETSDGRHLEHFYFSHQHFHQMKGVQSDEFPENQYHYTSCEKRSLLHAVVFPQGQYSHISYYMPGEGGITKDHPLCFRVKELKIPSGPNSDETLQRRFVYYLDEKKTTVYDAYSIPTDYYWNEDLRLIQIDRFIKPGILYNREKFIWGDNSSQDSSNLLCKLIFDAEGRPIFAKRYFYDSYGNVREERFYGNLTGNLNCFELDEKGFPSENTECYTKRFEYSQDGKNLLQKKEEDNGLSAIYTYHSNTPLLRKEIYFNKGTAERKKEYLYNSKNILIKEISEDFIASIYLSTCITPLSSSRYVGMPEIIEEKCGIQDALLKKIHLSYTNGGRIEKKRTFDSYGNHRFDNHYVYHKTNLIEEKNALNAIAYSRYDALNNRIFYQDFGSNCQLHIEYDYRNRPFKYVEKGDGLEKGESYFYSLSNTKTETHDEYGNKTTFTHDPFGHLIQTKLPSNAVISFTYDALGNELSYTDGEGHTRKTAYNAYGKPTQVSYPDGTFEKFYYYKDGSLERHIDQIGTETYYTYDAFGRLLTKTCSGFTEKWTYSGLQCLSYTDKEGHTTDFQYDEAGRKKTESIEGRHTFYTFDSLGRVHTITRGDVKTIKEYDLLDHLTFEKKETINGDLLQWIHYEYNNAGSLLTTTKKIQDTEYVETYSYDSFLRPTRKKDPLGHETIYRYDPNSNKKTTEDPDGLQIVETFDCQKRLVLLEKKSKSGDLLLQTDYSYDFNGNVTEIKAQSLNYISVTSQEYDSMNRVIKLSEGTDTSIEKTTFYSYTPKGLLKEIKKPSGIILWHEYDNLGRLSHLTSSDSTIDYSYEYTPIGYLAQSINHKEEEILTQHRDPFGSLTQEILPSGLQLENHYDDQGRRTTFSLPDRSSIHYTYRGHLLESISRMKDNSRLYTHTYQKIDPSLNVLQEKSIFGFDIFHLYDGLNRHVEVNSPYFFAKDCVFDHSGNLLKMNRNNKTLCYEYDSLYQLIKEPNHTYTYDAQHNRLSKDSNYATTNSLNQTSELIYNADGNPLFWKDKALSYDALDRLIEVEDSLHKTTYTYDCFNRRLSKKTFDLQEGSWQLTDICYFIYDGENEIGVANENLEILELRVLGNTFSAEIGSAIAFELNGEVYAPIYDLQGNVAILLSSSIEEYSYTAYGEELSDSKAPNPWRFSSKRVDPETGFIYYGKRYYIPELGRWLTPDPLGLKAGPNLYAFVLNAPLTHLDLYGLLEAISGEKPFFTKAKEYTKSFTTKYISDQSHVYSVGSIDLPKGAIGFINGIFNTPEEAKASAQMISNLADGAKVTGIYSHMHINSLQGVANIFEAFALIPTSPVDLIKQECLKFVNTRPDIEKMLWFCHSNGASLLYKCLDDPEIRKYKDRFIVVPIAPATIIPEELCFRSRNYASTRDFIPLIKFSLGSATRGPQEFEYLPNEPKVPKPANIEELKFLTPDKEAKFFDHSFNSPTFSRKIKQEIKTYLAEYGNL